MLKLRLMMENVAEKFFGRFLPQLKAQAMCSYWEYRYIFDGHCCSINFRFARREEKRECNPCLDWCGDWIYVRHLCDLQSCRTIKV